MITNSTFRLKEDISTLLERGHFYFALTLDKVQRGLQPDDFKTIPTIGKGVEEVRIWDDSGTYRVIYTARRAEAVYVLHAFQKKTQATSKRDIEIAKTRYTELMRGAK
jgi:phage-related protein